MVERAAPQSQLDALLGGDWADRASYIASQGEGVWSTFGADPAVYANTQQAILAALDNPAVNPMTRAAEQGYSASADNRTIWLHAHDRPVQHAVQFRAAGEQRGLCVDGPAQPALDHRRRHHRRASGSTRACPFNNPVHAASVPANPTGPGIGPGAGPVSLGQLGVGL